MKLKRHRIEGATQQKARWIGGVITPEVVILHDTASSLKKGSSANYLATNNSKVSAHFVIERDGTLVQQVPTNRRANHAGKSHYHGRKGVNAFSIGIEIVNVGKMTAINADLAKPWFKGHFKRHNEAGEDGFDIVEMTTPEHGAGLWMDYTQAQIETVTALLDALFSGIKTLKDIRGHWYVSPGRKIDPNPLFPMEQMRSLILGREEPDEEKIAGEEEVQGGQFATINVPSSSLNMRRWPSFNPNVLATIPHGAIVPVIKQGSFDGRAWLKVQFGGQEGWIVSDYASVSAMKVAS